MRVNVRLLEVIAWALLAFIGACVMSVYRAQPLSNDSFQYLSAAESLKRGSGSSTTLVHFDVERAHRRIPAPLTTFPPGYPAAIAGASYFFVDLEAAARAVSVISFAGTAGLLAAGFALMNVPAFFRRALLLLFVMNAFALSYATAVMSESAFTLLTTCAVAALMWAESGPALPRVYRVRGAIACAAAGLSCWVRPAGFFLIAGIVCYALLQRFLRRDCRRGLLLPLALIPVASAVCLALRNLLAAGTLSGRGEMPPSGTPKELARLYVKAHADLFFGGQAYAVAGCGGLALLGLLTIVTVLGLNFNDGTEGARRHLKAALRNPEWTLLAVASCALIYSAGVFYAALTTAVSLGARIFLPALPLYLLLMGIVLSRSAPRGASDPRSRWLKAGLLLFVGGYVGGNARAVSLPPPPGRLEVLATWYAEPIAGGQILRDWVEANIPEGQVIMSASGQATGYFLRRAAVSMAGATYSRVRWECDEVKKQMKTYGVKYLILYKPSPAFIDPLPAESKFVGAAVSGPPPCGFVVAAEGPHVRILEMAGAP